MKLDTQLSTHLTASFEATLSIIDGRSAKTLAETMDILRECARIPIDPFEIFGRPLLVATVDRTGGINAMIERATRKHVAGITIDCGDGFELYKPRGGVTTVVFDKIMSDCWLPQGQVERRFRERHSDPFVQYEELLAFCSRFSPAKLGMERMTKGFIAYPKEHDHTDVTPTIVRMSSLDEKEKCFTGQWRLVQERQNGNHSPQYWYLGVRLRAPRMTSP